MTERATIHQSQQVGVETTPGVAVPANRRLSSTSISVSPSVEIETFKPAGSKHVTKTVASKELASVSVEGVPTYDELIYMFAMAYGNLVTTDNTDGTFTHEFSSKSRGADELLTLTVEQGDPVSHAHRVAGASLADLTLEFDRGGNTQSISGSGFGRAIEDGITMTTEATRNIHVLAVTGDPTTGAWNLTLDATDYSADLDIDATAADVQTAIEALDTLLGGVVGAGNVTVTGADGGPYTVEFADPTDSAGLNSTDTFDIGSVTVTADTITVALLSLDGPVVAANQVTIYADELAGDIGTTPLGFAYKLSLAHTGRQAPVWTLNRAEGSYAAQVETDPTLEAELTVQANAEGMALLQVARTQGKRFVRIEAVGPEIGSTGIAHSLVIDLVTRVSSVGEFGDEQGIYAIPFTLTPVAGDPDVASNTVTLVNAVAAL